MYNKLLIANHKDIGNYYLYITLVAAFAGTITSALMRTELYTTGERLFSVENQNYYNLTFTIHGFIMVFFVVMPGLYGGFGNYFIPINLGATEVAFPRINVLSLVLLPVAYLLMLATALAEFGSGIGWTIYPPLSTSSMSNSPLTTDLLVLGVAVLALSSFMSSLNFTTTMSFLRANGITSAHGSFLAWAFLFTALLLLFTLPVLVSGGLMLLGDLHLNTQFFETVESGDPLLFQHLFWFFGHPEVYIIILPAFGLISHILNKEANKPVYGSQTMILAMGCISVLGSVVWGHHMFTAGMEVDTRAYFSATTMLIAIPTGTKIFNWLNTYMNSRFTISNSTYTAFAFIGLFTAGGVTGVLLANGALDIALHDTYFVVAHFHYTLSLGAIIGLLAGIVYYQYDILGRTMTTELSSLTLITAFIVSVVIVFTPLHILGYNVMPRRIHDYADALESINALATAGAFMVYLSPLIARRI